MNIKSHFIGAFCAFALVGGSCGYSHAQTAQPPVTWSLSGNFDTGGTLIGSFIQDTYGYLLGNSYLFSTTGTTIGASTFDSANVFSGGTAHSALSFGNNAGYYLTLNFSHDLLTPSANAFTGTESYNGKTLNVSGTAFAVPGPVAGAGLLPALLGLLGFGLYRRRNAI